MPEDIKLTAEERTKAAIREKVAAGLDPAQAAEVVRAQDAWDASEEKKALEAAEADRLRKAARLAKV